MGVTNLKTGLLRKYAAWCGERIQLQKKIAKIEAEYETLSEKRDRVSRLDELTEATITIMGELNPAWGPDDTPPKLPKAQRIPFEHGATTVTAFSIMRELGRGTNPAELAPLVIERLGGDAKDDDLRDAVKSAIDASLRSASEEVRIVSRRPTRWEIIPPEEWKDPYA
ncbi:MAG: hypothetical protein KKE77_08365 [Alphaproteobacteria bacterium]|nr:hypothetical protein [Alphaproteobacteria bacterium]